MERADAGPGVHDLEARDRLLVAAIQLFSRKGYAATTVREIVAAAGVTIPVLYYHFQNKEGIFLALMNDALERFGAVVDSVARREGNAKERLMRLADEVFALFQDEIAVARVIYSAFYGPSQGAPAVDFDAYHEKMKAAAEPIVQEGIRSGLFRPGAVAEIIWAVFGAIHVAMELELSFQHDALGREGLARVLEVIFRGVCVPGAADGGKP